MKEESMCVCVFRRTLSLTHLVLVGSVGLRLRCRTIAEETHEHAHTHTNRLLWQQTSKNSQGIISLVSHGAECLKLGAE